MEVRTSSDRVDTLKQKKNADVYPHIPKCILRFLFLRILFILSCLVCRSVSIYGKYTRFPYTLPNENLSAVSNSHLTLRRKTGFCIFREIGWLIHLEFDFFFNFFSGVRAQ